MIKREGSRRLKLLGKMFLLVGCLGDAALYATSRLFVVEWLRQSFLPAFLFPQLSKLAVLGVTLWCGGWVLEGFVGE